MGQPWLSVIGIGEEGIDDLAPAARLLLSQAEAIVGGERHFRLLDGIALAAEKIVWTSFRDTVAAITERRGRSVVVLASGDPMHFGIGATLTRYVPPEEMTVLPHAGSLSLAAARLGWTVQGSICLSVHGRSLDTVNRHLYPGTRMLILSHDGTTPAEIARRLTDRGFGPSRLVVLENMGGPRENRVAATADAWTADPCSDLNTLAVEVIAGPDARPLSGAPGLPDDAYLHDGQLTKREVRAVTLAALAPMPHQVLWDVGAGSGAIAVEWLRAARMSDAVAVEKHPERLDRIARNAAALGVPHLVIVDGEAPAVLDILDGAPDAVFVGGQWRATGCSPPAGNASSPAAAWSPTR